MAALVDLYHQIAFFWVAFCMLTQLSLLRIV